MYQPQPYQISEQPVIAESLPSTNFVLKTGLIFGIGFLSVFILLASLRFGTPPTPYHPVIFFFFISPLALSILGIIGSVYNFNRVKKFRRIEHFGSIAFLIGILSIIISIISLISWFSIISFFIELSTKNRGAIPSEMSDLYFRFFSSIFLLGIWATLTLLSNNILFYRKVNINIATLSIIISLTPLIFMTIASSRFVDAITYPVYFNYIFDDVLIYFIVCTFISGLSLIIHGVILYKKIQNDTKQFAYPINFYINTPR